MINKILQNKLSRDNTPQTAKSKEMYRVQENQNRHITATRPLKVKPATIAIFHRDYIAIWNSRYQSHDIKQLKPDKINIAPPTEL